MKGALIIGGLIIIIAGVWFLQQPEPTTSNDSAAESQETAAAVTETDADEADESDDRVPAVGEVTIDSFNYGYSMDEIRVNEGDTITINLTNSDGFHDWVIDEFDAATEQINEGETTSVTFVADKAGTYEYYCSVGNHRAQGMVGTLIVE